MSIWRVVMTLAVVLGCGVFLPQCNPGGLGSRDFVRVSESGFDADDNAADRNEYAWSMRYFKPDDAETGHVYVGTGNNISGIFTYYAYARITGGDNSNPPVQPPEIRRYRPDLGENVWEKVFDYRDVEDDELFTYGFRFMLAYSAEDRDQKGGPRSTYLYAASQGSGSTLWRSKSGDPGTWESVFTTGLNHASSRAVAVHDGKLYVGFAFDTVGHETPPPAQIWVSENGVDFDPLIEDGFGNSNNRGVEYMLSYNGWLWAGTKNDAEGYEVWKLEGPGGEEPVKIVEHGGPDPANEAAGTLFVFKNKLYVGSLIFYGYNRVYNHGFKGCDLIRIDTDDSWETVVGKNGTSGYDSGFNYFTNAYCWQMEEHDGWLYLGTWDQGTLFAGLLAGIPELLEFANQQKSEKGLLGMDAWLTLTESGGDIFKTQDGDHWFPVTQDGLGNRENYGWRTMESTPDGELFLGAANPTGGLEVWKSKPEEPEEETEE